MDSIIGTSFAFDRRGYLAWRSHTTWLGDRVGVRGVTRGAGDRLPPFGESDGVIVIVIDPGESSRPGSVELLVGGARTVRTRSVLVLSKRKFV
jgi:hypothetical protein